MVFSVVTGKVYADNTGRSVEMPVLMTPQGPVRPLVDYCLSRHRSLPWQNKLVRGVKLFLEYLEVNAIQGEEEWRIFRNFANALRHGTFDAETRNDPSNLWWSAMSPRDANFMISQLSDFFDWLGHEDAPRAAKFNPRYTGNAHDQRLDYQAYKYRRDKAFLGHAWSGKPKQSGRLTRGELTPKVLEKRPPAFPEERFEELLFKGFRVAGKQDYRGMLISLLMFGGGLRVSEPFHLYIADVHPHWDDPSRAFVAVHHPSLGYAPDDWKDLSGKRGSREDYLALKYGLVPRHKLRSNLRAGWKHPALDDHWFMQVHWFPEVYGVWFMQIWKYYMAQVANIERNHPYAWSNLGSHERGGIYTIAQYEKALQNAVERIGLVYSKKDGTTAHGKRHAYGQRARRGGIDQIIIQRMMHHCSPDSQLVYTQPEINEVVSAITSATIRLNSTVQEARHPSRLAALQI